MAVPQSTENRALDQLEALLRSIGTPASAWLTAPVLIAEGPPGDAVPRTGAPALYAMNGATEPQDVGGGLDRHAFRVHLLVYVVAETLRDVNSAKADVLRALFAGEGSVTQALGQPFWPGQFDVLAELSPAGFITGRLAVFVDVSIDHAAP